GRLRAELERRRSGEPGAGPGDRNPSNNPTLPSMPMNGDRPGPGAAGDDLEDSFLPGLIELPDAERPPLEPRGVGSSLGMPTSTGARFHILRAHAQGGIGKVSVAFDAELQREVALKQIKPERADDADSRARFLLEAEVTGRLEHPGIVPVYSMGVDEQGRPFYAMRFVRGTSLDEEIRRYHQADVGVLRKARSRALELRQLLDRFAAVCHTIAYAHSRGVLHRDLKPANILLGPFNESLVVDWGLAKVFARGAGEPAPQPSTAAGPEPETGERPRGDRPDSGPGRGSRAGSGDSSREGDDSRVEPPLSPTSSTDTAVGTAFGTPAYMSPEQAEGRLDQLGPGSDVYSLGAMLYTLLSGRPPFEYVWCDVTALLDRV